ncbi:DNA/RNA non-specific endonuclease [Oceanospirillum linum]|uniref:DNA/RNA non-specific endonuclease n=1 Tax=Oceanospirillum linum TaxID=966 RepID=UPI00089F020B|nr:DNA/RNA non-specific endonuclease [Oceanospirillum linum]SEF71814.1 endonuclease G [Oleiphilus messinensis]SMP15776.1 endonuclease G [Oceanospirillum linum]
MRSIPVVFALVLALLGSTAWYFLEQNSRNSFIYGGMPERMESGWRHWYRVLRNDGFMVGYSDLRMNPLWATYWLQELTAEQKRQSYKRPGQFSEDWRTVWRVSHRDYTRSGYDRGHLAPNYAISRLYGKQAQTETFLMTNIVPQKPNLNRKVWQRLEEAAVDHFTGQFARIAVITGPVFDQETERLDSWVEVPDAFYKIFVGLNRKGEAESMLAFLMPQNVRGSEPLTKFVVSVDQVEEVTGLNFFNALPDSQEVKLEAMKDSSLWRLNDVARKPSRY